MIGHVNDIRELESFVWRDIGNLTFEEAHAKTSRVLNITVFSSGLEGTPTLLNYLAAPNVVRNLW